MSSTAGTPPSPTIALPTTPEQPKGGILLNAEDRRLSDPSGPRPTISIPPTSPSLSAQAPSAGKSPSQRIRFAPLPDPRPRSLSTGQNIGWTAGVDENGNEVRHMEVRNIPQTAVTYDTDDADSDDEDKHRGRSWSKGMESSWKISKKILTVGMWDDKDDKKGSYDGGMPLKKSISTGGMIGSSPFRWSSVEDRKRSMQGLPAPPPTTNHRRMSSLDPATSSTNPASPQPVKVKLLNGRVYGARRASEIAELQKKAREADEPEFVEWGNAKPAVSSVPAATGGRGLLGDDDEGSGMEWVKRRREERQAKAREEAERKARESAESDTEPPRLSHSQSSPEADTTLTPVTRTSELPPTPRIHISEHLSPEHTGSQPMDIQPKRVTDDDVFEDDEEDDEGDDGDFSSDDEEEEEVDRTTSSAAGIEIMSRHHH